MGPIKACSLMSKFVHNKSKKSQFKKNSSKKYEAIQWLQLAEGFNRALKVNLKDYLLIYMKPYM
jgi:hypothetical protein